MPKKKKITVELTETQYDIIMHSIDHTIDHLCNQTGKEAMANSATKATLKNAHIKLDDAWFEGKWVG